MIEVALFFLLPRGLLDWIAFIAFSNTFSLSWRWYQYILYLISRYILSPFQKYSIPWVAVWGTVNCEHKMRRRLLNLLKHETCCIPNIIEPSVLALKWKQACLCIMISLCKLSAVSYIFYSTGYTW